MNLIIFVIMIIVSFIVVRIGAIALELTGMPWSLAKFQALSCFTGTGFTTKESELITTHVQRRKVASVLMILGNAGFVTLIATFANSMRPDSMLSTLKVPYLNVIVPRQILPIINFLVVLCFVFVIFKIFGNAKLAYRFRSSIRKYFLRKEIIKQVSFEELSLATGGYGVAQIEICRDSPLLDKKIFETDLRKNDITILTVERNGETIPNPPADTMIRLGDSLACFGKLDHIRRELGSPAK